MTKNRTVLPLLGAPATAPCLPWIETQPQLPYFVTEHGETWMPIGQNDAVTWPELQGLFRRKDLTTVEQYLQMLQAHGVTCLRLMLEYCQGEHRYFEKPVGRFVPAMVHLWDDLFALCEHHGLRILLTPFDTFWMWIRWANHPYNRRNAGPCARRNHWLLCADTRAAIKTRLAFATERWGGSGALFAWDLWNEIHPAHAGDSSDIFFEFIQDISQFLHDTEVKLHGRAHLQTVSVFGPILEKDAHIAEPIFRHPRLQFANSHFYEYSTIDHPQNTVAPARAVGHLVQRALKEINDYRPFFDSEHGPIHAFKDKNITLPAPFDDEYFRHIQWAHLASGGAGGGMRWPNRHPHTLTPGMRAAQRALADFLPLINWNTFRRNNWNDPVQCTHPAVQVFACGDEQQAVLWLLRTDIVQKNGMLQTDAEALTLELALPMPTGGTFQISLWDTRLGKMVQQFSATNAPAQALRFSVPNLQSDLAVAVQLLSTVEN